jgi:hypothetical protein
LLHDPSVARRDESGRRSEGANTPADNSFFVSAFC